MINFKVDNGVFNFRVAGILFNGDKVLVHKGIGDDFYAFPGGRLEMFETTENTIVREMKEELDIDVEVERLLWVCENFFNLNDKKYHEICYYYLIKCNDEKLLEKDDVFYIKEGKNEFEFKWVTKDEVKNEIIYPTFIKDRLNNLPENIERIVEWEL